MFYFSRINRICFLLVPEENVATHHHGTMCVEGSMGETLLNGDHENYNMDYGYTLHMINDLHSEGITGELYIEFLLRDKHWILHFIYYSETW